MLLAVVALAACAGLGAWVRDDVAIELRMRALSFPGRPTQPRWVLSPRQEEYLFSILTGDASPRRRYLAGVLAMGARQPGPLVCTCVPTQTVPQRVTMETWLTHPRLYRVILAALQDPSPTVSNADLHGLFSAASLAFLARARDPGPTVEEFLYALRRKCASDVRGLVLANAARCCAKDVLQRAAEEEAASGSDPSLVIELAYAAANEKLDAAMPFLRKGRANHNPGVAEECEMTMLRTQGRNEISDDELMHLLSAKESVGRRGLVIDELARRGSPRLEEAARFLLATPDRPQEPWAVLYLIDKKLGHDATRRLAEYAKTCGALEEEEVDIWLQENLGEPKR